jgi:hypothetical protein
LSDHPQLKHTVASSAFWGLWQWGLRQQIMVGRTTANILIFTLFGNFAAVNTGSLNKAHQLDCPKLQVPPIETITETPQVPATLLNRL